MTAPLAPYLILAAIAVAVPGAAAAQPRPPAPDIAEVTVVAAKDTKVLNTYPAAGQNVPGGPLVLKIVFEQPMTPKGWSYTASAKGKFPSCLANPRLLNDRKTFVLLCSLETNSAFGLQVNATPQFASAGGRPAPPFQLTFTTSDTLTPSLEDALKAAGLTDADDPIMGETAGSDAIQSPAKPAFSGSGAP